MSFIGEAFLISVLWIFHTSLSLYLYITMYTQAFCRIMKNLLGGRSCADRIQDLCKQLTKIPHHISFLFLEDSISEKSVAKLVLWSLVLGIQNVSLYDRKGKLKQNQDLLLIEIHQQIKKLNLDRQVVLTWHRGRSSYAGDEQTVIIAKNGAMFPDVNGNGRITLNEHKNEVMCVDSLEDEMKNGLKTKNGQSTYLTNHSHQTLHINGKSHHVGPRNGDVAIKADGLKQVVAGENGFNRNGKNSPRTLNLTLLSVQDGKMEIARCARKFCDKSGKLKSEEISENVLTSYLCGDTPDPSLLVRLGSANSNDEYPPWDLRLSEIHSIDTTAGLCLEQYLDVLRRYSRCEQRFGK